MRRSFLWLAALCLSVSAWLGTAEAGADPAPFSEVAATAGLDFVHFNGMSGELYFIEMVGAGAGIGVLDYDGDGDLDLYMVPGTRCWAKGHRLRETRSFQPPAGSPHARLTDRLYRNDPVVGERRLALAVFVDVTAESGDRFHVATAWA